MEQVFIVLSTVQYCLLYCNVSCALSIVLPTVFMWLVFGLEGGEEAGEGWEVGGGKGPVPTVALLVQPGIGVFAGGEGGEGEGGEVGIVSSNVNTSPHASSKHDLFQT